MAINIKVGDSFITNRSGEQVKALEVVPNKNGSARVRVEQSNGAQRWTTVQAA
jgi:hypothetical protein